MSINAIPPLTITDAVLTSTTVPETAPAAYNAGTTYALNAQCSVAGTAGLITVYKSLQAGNIAHTPSSSPTWWAPIGDTYQLYSGAATYAVGDRVLDAVAHRCYESLVAGNVGNALSLTTKWLSLGASNRYAMFDLLRNTSTTVPGPLTVSLTPGVWVNAIFLSGLSAATATIVMTVAGVPVWTRTYDLRTRTVFNWHNYWYTPYSTQPSILEFDLPAYASGVITITLNNGTSPVSCAACVIGNSVYLGEVEYEAESDTLNFSSVERDFAGNTSTMVQRRNVPRTVQNIQIEKRFVNSVRALRNAYGGIPIIWAGLDDAEDEYFESLLIAGFYKRFSINLKHPKWAFISLELEEI